MLMQKSSSVCIQKSSLFQTIPSKLSSYVISLKRSDRRKKENARNLSEQNPDQDFDDWVSLPVLVNQSPESMTGPWKRTPWLLSTREGEREGGRHHGKGAALASAWKARLIEGENNGHQRHQKRIFIPIETFQSITKNQLS